MKTAKEIDRAYSWNRMDSNLRSDTLRQVGVPEDFIDPVRRLDFNEIENSYPEIAEWLIDSAGIFNEPMFEDNVHSSIPLDQTHNISINDPNQYWNLTDIIGEGKASEMGDFMDMVERAEDIWRDLNETQRKQILEDSGLFGDGMWVGDNDTRDDNLSNVINHITPDAYKLDLYDMILDTYGSSKYVESKASEDGYSTARRIMKQQIRVMREEGDTDGADDLEWKLENGYYDEFGATGTQNPDLAESYASEKRYVVALWGEKFEFDNLEDAERKADGQPIYDKFTQSYTDEEEWEDTTIDQDTTPYLRLPDSQRFNPESYGSFNIDGDKYCSTCDGKGIIPDLVNDTDKTCPDCDGRGYTTEDYNSWNKLWNEWYYSGKGDGSKKDWYDFAKSTIDISDWDVAVQIWNEKMGETTEAGKSDIVKDYAEQNDIPIYDFDPSEISDEETKKKAIQVANKYGDVIPWAESKASEILGFDELLSEDLTYEEIVELTKGIPIDEIPEKLRHAGMKLQFDPDFKAGDNPYIGDWKESFSKESGFNFEDIEDGEVIPETDSLREYRQPKGFVNFNKKREEEIQKELDNIDIDSMLHKRELNKPISSYDDWINRNKHGSTESGTQLDVLYAEQESILQKINDLENEAIRIGLVGSDDEMIEIDDDIEFQKEKLQDVIKQIDNFAGETDWKQFTKDFVNLDNAGLDIHDLLELQKDKDIELAESTDNEEEKKFLDDYGKNVNWDESSFWDLFKDNVPKLKEHLTDEDVKDILEEIRAGGIIFNELSPEVQEELIQYSDDNKLYMGGKIDPSIFDDESYSKEKNLYSRVEPLNDIEKEIYLKQDGEDRYFWEKNLGSADPFNPYKKQNDESKSTEGGYGSGKNRHGFGHSKWMREAEVNDSIIKSEDMNKDAVPLEEYTYHSRRESNRHKRNPTERRLEDQIRKREKQLRDMGIDPDEEL